jgi:hypothetical protein
VQLDGDASVLAALAADLDDRTVIATPNVADVARSSSSARSPASRDVRISARSRSIQLLARRSDSESTAASSA